MQTWNDADKTLCEIARIDAAVADAKAIKDQIQLEAEGDFQKMTAPLLATKAVYVGELEAFYKTQKKKVEADGKRSVELAFGRLGMRKGNPTLALLKGWKWDKVLAEIKVLFARKADTLKALVNTKESCNKDGIKAQLDADALAKIGLKLTQDDEFYYETFPEKVNTTAAA
jgi:hypothetical protein